MLERIFFNGRIPIIGVEIVSLVFMVFGFIFDEEVQIRIDIYRGS